MKNRNRIYTNGEITIFWRAGECIHNTVCYTELRSVFDPMKRPWVNPNGASSKKIKEIIEKCPTMALTFKWNDESRNLKETSDKLFKGDAESLFAKPPVSQTCFAVRRNGPIVVSGNFTVMGEDGKPMRQMQMMSLCRCGASSNPPFCDGTHFKVGFQG